MKSSADSSSRAATIPSTRDPASTAFGPSRSMAVPTTGASRTGGSENATPNSATSAGVASYSNFAYPQIATIVAHEPMALSASAPRNAAIRGENGVVAAGVGVASGTGST